MLSEYYETPYKVRAYIAVQCHELLNNIKKKHCNSGHLQHHVQCGNAGKSIMPNVAYFLVKCEAFVTYIEGYHQLMKHQLEQCHESSESRAYSERIEGSNC